MGETEKAFGGRNPEVGRSSVKDDSEMLCWGSQGDGAIVLSIGEVSDRDFMSSFSGVPSG